MNAASRTSQILLAPWRQRNLALRWPRRLLWSGALLTVIAVIALLPSAQRGLAIAGMLDATLQLLWAMLVPSLLEQNHPTLARLVPGHLDRLRRTALAAWAACAGLGSLLLWLALPVAVSLPALLPALLLAHAALGVYLFWAMRFWPLWFLAWLLPATFNALHLSRHLQALWVALGQCWQEQSTLMTLLGLSLLAGLLAKGLDAGHAAHRRRYDATQRMRLAMRGQFAAAVTADSNPWGRAVPRRLSLPDHAIAAWLRHLLAQANTTPRSVMSRAEVVLHGPHHWLRQGVSTLLVLMVVATCFAAVLAFIDPQFSVHWRSGAFGMAIGLMSMGINPAFMLPAMLWHSRREQALLRLLPGMPQGQALNRAVARLQLRHTLTAWLLCTLAQGLLAWVAGYPAALVLAMAALPVCVAWPLPAPAWLRAPGGLQAIVPFAAYLLLVAALMGLHRGLELPLWTLAVLSIGLSLFVGGWRWRRLLAAPAALPAGRLA